MNNESEVNMDITVKQEDFCQAIKKVKNACAKNSSNPILKNLKLEAKDNKLTLTATRIDCTFISSIDADIVVEGVTYVDANKLDEIISKLDGEIKLYREDNCLEIKSGKSKFKIVSINNEVFPKGTMFPYETSITIDFKELKKGIKSTIFSCSSLANNILNGVCFNFAENKLKLCAIDGNSRMACCEILCNCDFAKEMVVPCFALSELIKNDYEEMTISLAKNKIKFESESDTFETVVLSGKFPSYEAVIPKDNDKIATISREKLLKAIEKVTVLVDNEKNRLSMAFNENDVELTCVNQNGVANDNIEIEYQGENFVVAFNYKYITEALKNSEVENIQIKVGNPEMPILFDLGFTGVIAPLKI